MKEVDIKNGIVSSQIMYFSWPRKPVSNVICKIVKDLLLL
jgi:hypothetical protein